MAYPPTALPNDTGNISANKSFDLKDFNDRFGNIKTYIESLKEGIDNKVDKIEGSSLVEDDYINALKAFLPICPNVSIYIDTYMGDGEIYFDDFIRKENDREFQFIFYVDKDYDISSVNDLNVQTYNGGYINLSKQFKANTGNYISKGYWVRTDGTHFYPARDFFAKFYRDLLTFLPFCEISSGSVSMSFKTNFLKDSQTFQYLFYIPNSITLNSTYKFLRYDGTGSITAGNCFFDDQALSSNIDFSGYWVRIDETHFYTAKTFFSKFKTLIDSKVDKVNGKGLSTNDFTNYYQSRIDLTQGLAFFPVVHIWDQASPFYPFVYSGYDGSSESAGNIPSLLIYDKNKILEKRHYIVEMNPNGYVPRNSSDISDIPFFVPNYRVLSGLPQLYVKSDITVNYTPPDFSEPFTLSLYVPTNDCSSGAMKHESIQIAKGSYNFYYPGSTSGIAQLNHTFCIPFSTYGTEIKNIQCKAYNINTDTGNNGNETYEYIKLLNCQIYPSLHNYSVSRLNGIPVKCSGTVDYMGRERCAWLEFDYYDPKYTVSSSKSHFGYNDNYIS